VEEVDLEEAVVVAVEDSEVEEVEEVDLEGVVEELEVEEVEPQGVVLEVEPRL